MSLNATGTTHSTKLVCLVYPSSPNANYELYKPLSSLRQPIRMVSTSNALSTHDSCQAPGDITRRSCISNHRRKYLLMLSGVKVCHKHDTLGQGQPYQNTLSLYKERWPTHFLYSRSTISNRLRDKHIRNIRHTKGDPPTGEPPSWRSALSYYQYE